MIKIGNIVSVCFLDVGTRFDTIPHSYLLRKLQMIQRENTSMLKNYLTDRTTRENNVNASDNNTRSSTRGGQVAWDSRENSTNLQWSHNPSNYDFVTTYRAFYLYIYVFLGRN